MVKKTLLSLAVATALTSMVGCNVSSTDKYDNKISNDGVQQAGASSVYPLFNPSPADGSDAQLPLATDIVFAAASASDGTADVDTSKDFQPNPVKIAIKKLDGFSTVAPLYIDFSNTPLDPDTVEAGKTVVLVKMNPGLNDEGELEPLLANDENPFAAEQISPDNYEARAITMADGTPSIQILFKNKPLDPKTKYLVVVTDGVRGLNGDKASGAATYEILASNDKINPSGDATKDEQTQALRSNIQGWQQAAGAYLKATGNTNKPVFSYTFTTGGTTDVLNAMAAPATFLAAKMPTYMHAEGAIKGAVEKAVREQMAGAEEDTIQTVIESQYEGKLTAITDALTQQLDAANAGNGNWTNLYPLTLEQRLPALRSEGLKDYYRTALITGIADNQGAGIDATVDKPQTRDYQAIISGSGAAVSVPYDTFLTAQITPKVHAAIEAQVRANPALEGADEAIIQAQIDAAIQANAPALIADQLDALSSHGAIYQGGLKIPSFLPDSEAGKHDMQLGTWVASDAAAQALGLPAAPRDVDGVSTNVTYRFPFADKVGDSVVPVMAVLPDATSCGSAPYPVAIYQHGITVDRTAGVLVGNALAKACVAMVAIDHAMHGVAPGNATGLVFSVNTAHAEAAPGQPSAALSPFALARAGVAGTALDPNNILVDLKERHNNVGKNDLLQNVAMTFAAAGAPADVGASGDLYINLSNFARTRDAMRQTVLDMLNLNASLADMDVDADGTPDFDTSKIYFVGHSLGGIVGTTFVGVNNDPFVQTYNKNLPKIQAAILGNPGGGVVKLLENSPAIGATKILPGLAGAAQLTQGSADIEKFFGVMQAMVDSADPINFAASAGLQNTPVLMYTAVGDLVVPNNALAEIKYDTGLNDKDEVIITGATPGAAPTAKSYLSGTKPLADALGLTVVNAATEGVPGSVMETRLDIHTAAEKSDHGTFSNAQPQETFAEIYGQIGSFIADKAVVSGNMIDNPLKLKGIKVENTDVLEQAE